MNYQFESEGGITLGGEAEVSVILEISQDFTWDIYSEIEIGFDSSWDIGDSAPRYYRILGKCASPECEFFGVDPNDSKCGLVRFLTIASASNLSELCRNLKNPVLNPPVQLRIERIDLLSRPVRKEGYEILRTFPRPLNDDGTPITNLNTNTECQTLIEQDFCSVPECFDFCLIPSTVVRVGGYASVSIVGYAFEPSGSINLGGSAQVTIFSDDTLLYGGVSLGGSAEIIASAYTYEMSGGISLGGTILGNFVSLPMFYNMTGGISLGGSAEIKTNSYGTLVVQGGGYAEVFDVSVEFTDSVDSGDLTIDDGVVVTACGCGTTPLTLRLDHTLIQNNSLSDFIRRNRLSLDKSLVLRYRSSGDSWQCHTHLMGTGVSGHQERWLVRMEFACIDELNGDILGTNQWKFSMFITRADLGTGLDTETKLLVTIPANYICFNSDLIDLQLTLNTRTGDVSLGNGFTEVVVFSDRIGLFKNAWWQSNPNLTIRILETDVSFVLPRYDLQPIFPTG